MPKTSWKCCDCGVVTTNPEHQLIEYGFHNNCPAKTKAKRKPAKSSR